MPDENNGKGAGKLISKKIVAIIIMITIIVSTITGALIIQLNQESQFFNYALGGYSTEDTNITGSISLSDPPILNQLTTIRWHSYYDNNLTTYKHIDTRYYQIMLPNSIELIEGEEKILAYPGDPLDFKWIIKPTQLGDHFIKLGVNFQLNMSLIDEDLDYYEIGSNPSTFIIGLGVEEDTGRILEPEESVLESFDISGYKSSYNNSLGVVYCYNVGDSVWLNVNFTPVVDLPLMRIYLGWPGVSSPTFQPLNNDLDRVVNLSAYGNNNLNFSFRILQDIPYLYQNIKIHTQAPGSVALLGPNGVCALDGYSDRILISIQTNSTRG